MSVLADSDLAPRGEFFLTQGKYLKDVFVVLDTIQNRNDLKWYVRKWGYLVYIVEDNKFYELTKNYVDSNLQNNQNWKVKNLGQQFSSSDQLIVDGNNTNLGDGSILNPFNSVNRAIEKVKGIGAFQGEAPITNRITIVVKSYEDQINTQRYFTKYNLWMNVNWIFERGAKIQLTSVFSENFLFDQEPLSDYSYSPNIFGEGVFVVGDKGFFKSANTKNKSYSTNTDYTVSFAKVEGGSETLIIIGATPYSGSGEKRPKYNVIGVNNGQYGHLQASPTNKPLIWCQESDDHYSVYFLKNIFLYDLSRDNDTSIETSILKIDHPTYGTEMTDLKFAHSVHRNYDNKSAIIEVNGRASVLRMNNLTSDIGISGHPIVGFLIGVDERWANGDFAITNSKFNFAQTTTCTLMRKKEGVTFNPEMILNNVVSNVGVTGNINDYLRKGVSSFAVLGEARVLNTQNFQDTNYSFLGVSEEGALRKIPASLFKPITDVTFYDKDYVSANATFSFDNGKTNFIHIEKESILQFISVRLAEANAGANLVFSVKRTEGNELTGFENQLTIGNGSEIWSSAIKVQGTGTRKSLYKTYIEQDILIPANSIIQCGLTYVNGGFHLYDVSMNLKIIEK